MSKFNGIIAYSKESETIPGVWDRIDVESVYKGNILDMPTYSLEPTSNANDPIYPRHSISIIPDDELVNNINSIRYVIWLNQKWTVKTIKYKRPRLILYLGGPYNG